jgi:predicted kinase
MSFYILIRGPAASGKTTISKELSKLLDAQYFSFDEIMHTHKLDTIEGGGIRAKNFIKANNILIPNAKRALESGRIVIFDGCFYRKTQVSHLLSHLNYKHYIFDLHASLKECILRNSKRKNKMPTIEVKKVYVLVRKNKLGITIPTSKKTPLKVAKIIQSKL